MTSAQNQCNADPTCIGYIVGIQSNQRAYFLAFVNDDDGQTTADDLAQNVIGNTNPTYILSWRYNVLTGDATCDSATGDKFDVTGLCHCAALEQQAGPMACAVVLPVISGRARRRALRKNTIKPGEVAQPYFRRRA